MAKLSFEVKYYFDAKGLDWAEMPEDSLNEIVENCQTGIWLDIDSIIYPENAEINEVDNYSGVPIEAAELGFDSFALVHLTFDIENSVLENLEIEEFEESESFEGDVDSLFGSGVFGVSQNLMIGKPTEIWID